MLLAPSVNNPDSESACFAAHEKRAGANRARSINQAFKNGS